MQSQYIPQIRAVGGICKAHVSKEGQKFDEILTVDLALCSKYQIDGEDFVNFCGLLRKRELYCKRETSEIKFANFIEFRAWEYYEFCRTLKSTHLYIY